MGIRESIKGMKQYLFDRQLQRLERDGNDDLMLIMEFGADAYSTRELSQLLRHIVAQKQTAERWYHRLFLLGFSVSFWIAASFLAAASEASVLSLILLTLVPVSLLSVLFGHFYLSRRYPAHRDIHLVASIIEQELDRRKKDASIF